MKNQSIIQNKFKKYWWSDIEKSLAFTKQHHPSISFPRHPSIRDFSFCSIGFLVYLQKLFANSWYPSHLGYIEVRAYGFFWNLNLFNQSMTNFLNIVFKNFMTYFIAFKIYDKMIFRKSSCEHIFYKILFS